MIKPLRNFVIVDIGKGEGVTDSGIIVPDGVNEDVPQTAKIVDSGPDCSQEWKKDQKVFIRTYGWEKFNEKENRYLLGEESNILGIL